MGVQLLPRNFTRITSILALVAVSLLLSALPLYEPWLTYIFKPVATALILAISLRNWRQQASPLALWISLGLFLSLIGDILLMLPGNLFLYGLTAFLLAHISYLVGFARDVKFPARVSVWILYLAIIGSFYEFLRPTIPPGLRLPVAIYVFVVTSMAAQSMGRFLILKNNAAFCAAAGTLLFVLSDSLLSFDRFRASIPWASFFILVSYYAAQWLIALSTSAVASHTEVEVL